MDREDPKTLFCKEVTCQLRKLDAPTEQGLDESILCRVISRSGKCTLSLTSESDLFFNFYGDVDQAEYEQLRKEQGLMINFDEFPTLLVKLLCSAMRDPKSYMLLFFINGDGMSGKVQFVENFKSYKFVELLTLSVQCADHETIRDDISKRYSALRKRNQELGAQVSDMKNVLKQKLPNFPMSK